MLKDYDFKEVDDRYDNFKRSDLGEEIDKLQRIVQRLKIPVLILVDGWESSGKGDIINDLTRELDPRYVKVELFDERSDTDDLHASVWRFWQKIPNNEEISVFDQSFYSQVLNRDERSTELLKKRTEELLQLERMLLDDGTIVIKFFLHISKETQAENIKLLEESKYRQFLLSDDDYKQNKHYEDYLKWFDKVLTKTNFAESPWNIINGEDRKLAAKTVLGITLKELTAGIERVTLQRERADFSNRNYHQGEKQLEKIDLSKSISEKQYDDQLEDLQKKAAQLVYECYTKDIAIVIAFEGVDAAGKGGAIQRLTRHIDPRSYRIYGIKAPTDLENQYHYMWRFWTKFPEDGDMVIMDRSWYGRVLVERVEGFAKESEWERAYNEINHTEKVLTDHGNIIMKFFMYIDEEEQKQRFEDRMEEPDKNYKITAEDWRNRNQWESYMDSYEEMLSRTDTPNAPWYVVGTNDKHYARIQVLKHFIKHVKKHLSNIEKGE
ncbi:phosphate:AMP phosphotransferase [Aerococcaceae bacterium WGS1372]